MTALPETLQELLQRAQVAVERHPQHDLNLGYRQAIGRAFGPYRNRGLPGSAVAHRRRARLAILTVRRVLPLWEACFPEDERPQRVLEMAEGVLRGELLPEDANRSAARFWDDLDALQLEFEPERAPMALTVGYAAASALVAACGEAWDDLDVEEIDYESVDSRDFSCNDTAFYASIAYAGGPVWEILARVSPDAERRRAFWTWWLTEAVPLAWEAEGAVRELMNGAGVYLAEVKERFSSLDYPVSPCSEEEIAALESRLGFPLPAAYREFLAWMGRRAEGFMVGTDFYYAELWDAREEVIELLRENNAPEALPEDAVIILLHQGYTFAFIRAGEGDDPPVYFYTESQNDDRFTRVSPHYSDYLLSLLERHLDYVKEFGSVSPELE